MSENEDARPKPVRSCSARLPAWLNTVGLRGRLEKRFADQAWGRLERRAP